MRLGEYIRLSNGRAYRVISYMEGPTDDLGYQEEMVGLLRLKPHALASKQYGPAAWGHDPENCEECYKEPVIEQAKS